MELVDVLDLESSVLGRVSSSLTEVTKMRIIIPYELIKIYRDQGIILSGLSPMYLFGESYDSFYYQDNFNGAF